MGNDRKKTPIFLTPEHIDRVRRKLQQNQKRSDNTALPTGEAIYGISRRAYKAYEDNINAFSPVENKAMIWGASPDHPMEKTAQIAPDLTGSAGSQVSFFPPLWFSPLMSWVHFYMPRDIKTTYTWLRHWDTFHPHIGNAIDLHCLPPDEVIYTSKGIRRIQDVTQDNLQDEYVYNLQGKPQKILANYKELYEGDLITFRAFGLLPIRVTGNHPVLVIPKGKRQEISNKNIAIWKLARELEIGDYVIFPKMHLKGKTQKVRVDLAKYIGKHTVLREQDILTKGSKYKSVKNQKRFIEVDEKFAKFIGYYVARGVINGLNVDITFNPKVKSHADIIVSLVEEIFGIRAHVYHRMVVITASTLSNFLKAEFGYNSRERKLPEFFMNSPISIIKVFLRTYFDLKGKVHSGFISLKVKSEILARQIQILGNKCGLFFAIRQQGNAFEVYTEYDAYKKAILSDMPSMPEYDKLYGMYQDRDNFYLAILDVKSKKYSGEVYNLTTEDATFTMPIVVHNTQMPLSRFSLKVDDPYVRAVYESMMEMLGGLLLLYDMVRDYWLLGEVFAYLYWDESVGMFTDIQILPPEDIIVKGSYYNQRIYLNPESIHIQPDSQIDRVILERATDLVTKIQKHEPIELDPFFVIQMQRKQSAYFLRGQSIVLRALKFLIYYDKLIEAQYAIAQRHITPKEIWTIGNDNYPATAQQIEELRQLVQRAGQSPLFTLFTNHTVKLEYAGANGKFINFAGEYEMIEKLILTAMFTNKAITHGEGPNFACNDVDTQILTENGFKYYWELRDDDLIATFNAETGEIEYQPLLEPAQKYVYDYADDLVAIEGDLISLRHTPNHRMVVYEGRKEKDKVNWDKEHVVVKYAEDLEQDLGSQQRLNRLVLGIERGKWKGEKLSDYPELFKDEELFAKFIGYYVALGYLDNHYTTVQFNVGKGSKQDKKLNDLLKSLSIDLAVIYSIENTNQKVYSLNDLELYNYLFQGRDKLLRFIGRAGYDTLRVFFGAYLEALGVEQVYPLYLTLSNKDIADILQEIVFKLGFVSILRENGKEFILKVSNNEGDKYPIIDQDKVTLKRTFYKGKVWSVKVPNGLVVIRRNGKINITGNTASVGMRVLMQRYMYVRGLLESVLLNNLFLPVAVANEFYEVTQAELSHRIRRPFSERKPILPEFNWRAKANLLDSPNMASVARQLKDMGFSHKAVCDLLGVDYEYDKYWREKEEGTVFDPLYDEWRRRMGQSVPTPIGTERTSTFKLPVQVASYKVSKDTEEPIVEEKEFTWVSRGGLLNKMKHFKYHIEPYLKSQGAVPAKIVGDLVPKREGSPLIKELSPITEEEFMEIKRELENKGGVE